MNRVDLGAPRQQGGKAPVQMGGRIMGVNHLDPLAADVIAEVCQRPPTDETRLPVLEVAHPCTNGSGVRKFCAGVAETGDETIHTHSAEATRQIHNHLLQTANIETVDQLQDTEARSRINASRDVVGSIQ